MSQPTEAQVEAVARAIRDADPIPMSMFQMDEIRDLARAAITAYQATSLAGSGDVADALERAAKVCDALADETEQLRANHFSDWSQEDLLRADGTYDGAKACATAIRAGKE